MDPEVYRNKIRFILDNPYPDYLELDFTDCKDDTGILAPGDEVRRVHFIVPNRAAPPFPSCPLRGTKTGEGFVVGRVQVWEAFEGAAVSSRVVMTLQQHWNNPQGTSLRLWCLAEHYGDLIGSPLTEWSASPQEDKPPFPSEDLQHATGIVAGRTVETRGQLLQLCEPLTPPCRLS